MPDISHFDDSGKKAVVDSNESKLLTHAVDSAYSQGAAQNPLRLQLSSLVKSEAANGGPSALLDGITDGAVRNPVKAVRQLFGSDDSAAGPAKAGEPPALRQDSTTHKVGEIIGSLVPFVGLSVLTRGASTRLFGQAAEPSVMRLMGEQATSGFVLGSLLTPTELKQGDNLLTARLQQGGTLAATFATMAGTGYALNKALPEFGTGMLPTLARRGTIGAFSGAAGGLVDAEGRTGFKASTDELVSSTLGYAAFGTLAEVGGTAAKSYFNKPAFSESAARIIDQHFSPARDSAALRALTSDANTTIISSPGGWYDKLNNAIRKAPQDHTIIVTEQKWLDESRWLLKDAKRPDVKVVLGTADGAAAEGAATVQLPKAVETAKPVDVWEQRRNLVDNLKREVVAAGEDPGTAIANALKRSRAVLVGEYHTPDNAHRELGAQIMPQLKKAGLTHLAIEHSSDFQGKIFTPEGKVDVGSLPELLKHPEFSELLEAAKKANIEVVPVDSSYNGPRDLLYRNIHMDQQIANILDQSPKNKVLFWVGNYHLHMGEIGDEGPQVAKLLRDRNIPVTSFYGQHDNYWREEPVRNLYTPDKALAVPIAKAPTLGNLNWLHPDEPGHDVHKFSEFDYVLMHPQQRVWHYD